MNLRTPTCIWSIVSGMLLLASSSGCASSRPEPVVMPPELPGTSEAPPAETVEASSLPIEPRPLTPEGITLSLEGAPVALEGLPPIPVNEASKTILVEVSPSTPYPDVERVLDQLHDLGYLIEFKPKASQ